MDRLKRTRRPIRIQITKTANDVDAELGKEQPDLMELRVHLDRLVDILPVISEIDQRILDALLDANCTDEDQLAESQSMEEYRDKIRRTKLKINRGLGRPASPSSSSGDFNTAASSSGVTKRTYKLPKIEIKKFNGELTEWLSFWSQFQKIHEDDELHDSDKFQYLVQSITTGTRARKLVESYPQSADNYQKVIDALKDRYGDKVILTEVYVRQLLKLVINNVGKSKENVSLATMYDELESHLRSLESLGVTADQSASFLYPLVESSLPIEIVKVWQRSPLSGYEDDGAAKSADDRLKSLMKFLHMEVKGAERLSYVVSGLGDVQKPAKKGQSSDKRSTLKEVVPTAAGLLAGYKNQCIFCDKVHDSDKCGKAQSMALQEKKSIIDKKKCCFLCLKFGHLSKQCKVFLKCLVCGKKHLTLLCPDLPSHQKEDKKISSAGSQSQAQTSNSNLACSTKVILKTLIVCMVGKKKTRWVRALLDDGSQRSYILKSLAEDLGLSSVGSEDIIHALFTGVQTGIQRHQKYRVTLRNKRNQLINIEALDQGKICGVIPRVSTGPWLQELKSNNIWISDVGRGEKEVELLIGADAIGQLLTGQLYRLQNGLTAVETTLGWTLMGKVKNQNIETESVAMTVTSMTVSDSTIQQLWDLEAIGIHEPSEMKSKEESELLTKQHFLQTVTRSEDGRYSVRLPWIDESVRIPDNRNIAEKRLLSMTSKLQATGNYNDYDKMFKAWEQEGIIEEVHDSKVELAHYLPHRPVFKPESLTTPIRPVFDASCKTNRTPSLNDCLHKGPNLMELIPSILLRFREKKIGITSDIRKAFLMIEVNQKDRDFLRFLWWEDPVKKLFKIYRHRRVVFGVNCSPFLLAAVIEFHLSQVDVEDKLWAVKLLKSLYVDNCVSSEDTIEDCKSFKDESIKIMADAKMELRQWEFGCSGEATGIGQLTSSGCGLVTDRTDSQLDDGNQLVSVLGLTWNKDDDTLCCESPPLNLPEKITKRVLLSFAQKIFDPIGFTCPAVLKPKLLLQSLWQDKIGWDEEVGDEVKNSFITWCQELNFLQQIKIPRNASGFNSNRVQWQLHTFCDASKDAYAAVVFLRTDDGDRVSLQLLQAKARVAPLKKTSIPRLELLGCTIAARLTMSIMDALSIKDVPVYYWCDSSTALAWIRRNDDWGTFVGNRVREIIKLSGSQNWKFVPGIMNPADLPSRGSTPAQLLHSRWWEGPQWLRKSEESWPSKEDSADEVEVAVELKKKSTMTLLVNNSEIPWYAPKSNYSQNVRVIAWVRRFIHNCRSKVRGEISIKNQHVTFEEFKLAEINLLRLVQSESFSPDQSVISGIRVIRNENGLICVKTKLLHRQDTFGFRFPILLPNSHWIVDQIIRGQHLLNRHAGVQFLMGNLREHYWIIQGRKAVRKIINKCVVCRRFTSKKIEVVPAPLPEDRVKTAKVFEVVGVDLAGPLFLKKKEKAWIVLFTCGVYRCVHLELVKAISTEAFLDAFSRFTSRRGRPATVYSDNGTNFVGTNNAFKQLDWEKIVKHCGLQRIDWKFNPPSAAWWGGWWERLVRSIKDLLRRVLGKSILSFEKMETYLCEIESVINGRPLTTVTEDPEDLVPLTPSMFLQEMPNTVVKDLDLLDASGFQKLLFERKTIMDEFKMRFRKEYLSLLVQKGKEKKFKEFKVGDVVLVGSDNKKRWEWPLAKILELIPGKDGHVRVARVKTTHGELVRPVQRLYNMEVSSHMGTPVVLTMERTGELRTRSGRRIKLPHRFGQE